MADDRILEVRCVVYVQVDPKAWSETMMERPTSKRNIVRDDVKRFIEAEVGNLAMRPSKNSEEDTIPIGEVWVEGIR